MILWWIGNIVLIFVVAPVVVLLLQQLAEPIAEIKKYADDALEHGVELIAALDAVDELQTTRDLVQQAGADLRRYAQVAAQIA